MIFLVLFLLCSLIFVVSLIKMGVALIQLMWLIGRLIALVAVAGGRAIWFVFYTLPEWVIRTIVNEPTEDPYKSIRDREHNI